MQRMRDNIKGVFASRSTLLLDVHKTIEILNPKIIGMRNYYGLKNAGISQVRKAYLWKGKQQCIQGGNNY